MRSRRANGRRRGLKASRACPQGRTAHSRALVEDVAKLGLARLRKIDAAAARWIGTRKKVKCEGARRWQRPPESERPV